MIMIIIIIIIIITIKIIIIIIIIHFSTVFTKARCWSLSSTIWIQQRSFPLSVQVPLSSTKILIHIWYLSWYNTNWRFAETSWHATEHVAGSYCDTETRMYEQQQQQQQKQKQQKINITRRGSARRA